MTAGEHSREEIDLAVADAMLGVTVDTERRRQIRYHQTAENFRIKFFKKLIKHDAFDMDEGYGWAVFDDRTIDSKFQESGKRKVLLLGYIDEGSLPDKDGLLTPSLRIITNELVSDRDVFQLLTEDVTVDDTDGARYMTSAQLRPWVKRRPIYTHSSHVSDDGSPSYSPRFTTKGQDLTIIQEFQTKSTPLVGVIDPTGEFAPVYPYGRQESLSDQQYALAKAVGFLASIIASKPSRAFQATA